MGRAILNSVDGLRGLAGKALGRFAAIFFVLSMVFVSVPQATMAQVFNFTNVEIDGATRIEPATIMAATA